jgi:cell division protein FtsA
VLGVGGNHITSDIAHGLRLPLPQAEEVKKLYGNALSEGMGPEDAFSVRAFGGEHPMQASRRDLAEVIEARVEEIFELVMQEIKRSGYDGLLPAGLVLTGGSSLLPGMREVASRVTGLPVRIAKPENLVGLVDQLNSPAYSTSVGLIQWAMLMQASLPKDDSGHFKGIHLPRNVRMSDVWEAIKKFGKKMLPE